jgi:hypothetical protein
MGLDWDTPRFDITTTSLTALQDVTITDPPSGGECLCYDKTTEKWINFEDFKKTTPITSTQDLVRMKDSIIDTSGGAFTVETPPITAESDNKFRLTMCGANTLTVNINTVDVGATIQNPHHTTFVTTFDLLAEDDGLTLEYTYESTNNRWLKSLSNAHDKVFTNKNTDLQNLDATRPNILMNASSSIGTNQISTIISPDYLIGSDTRSTVAVGANAIGMNSVNSTGALNTAVGVATLTHRVNGTGPIFPFSGQRNISIGGRLSINGNFSNTITMGTDVVNRASNSFFIGRGIFSNLRTFAAGLGSVVRYNNATGELYRQSSCASTKENIISANLADCEVLYNVDVRQFNYIGQATTQKYIGLISNDIETAYASSGLNQPQRYEKAFGVVQYQSDQTEYDPDGDPPTVAPEELTLTNTCEGVDVERIVPMLLKLIQDLHTRIVVLETYHP